MKIIRFEYQGKKSYGYLEDGQISIISGDIFNQPQKTGEKLLLTEVRVLSPLLPSKVVGLGLNYRKHVEEIGFDLPKEPLIFLKPPSAVIGHLDTIQYPADTKRVDFEGELGLVIGKTARMVEEEDALDYVFGCTVANDVSARDYQDREGQWTRGKGFDTFCPLGPVIATGIDPDNLSIKSRLNGKTVQDSTTADQVFNNAKLVSFVSKVMTLLPGDVILTGTPSGIGPMEKGDEIEIEIEGIGVLKNIVQ